MVKNYPRLHPWATHWPINANQVPRRPERDYDLSRPETERWYQLSAFNQYWLILIGIDCIKTLIPNRRCDYVMGGHDILLKTMSLAVQAGGNINLTVSCYWTLSLFCGHFLIYDICVLWRLLVTAEQLSNSGMLTEQKYACYGLIACLVSEWNPVLFKGLGLFLLLAIWLN